MRKIRIHLVFFILTMLAGGFLALVQGQDTNWDLQNYHYYNPHSFLTHRTITDVAPDAVVTYENPLRMAPAYLAIEYLTPKQGTFMLGALQGINAWLVFEICLLFLVRPNDKKRRQRTVIAAVVGLASLLGAVNLSEMGNTMADNITSIFVLSAVWLLAASFKLPERYKVWYKNPQLIRFLSYVAVGIAVGLKMTNAIYAVGLIIAGLFVRASLLTKVKQGALNVIGVGVGVMLSAGLWYAHIWQILRNPIYPFFNKIFQSPYYASTNFVDAAWLPKSIKQAVFQPFYLWTESSSMVTAQVPFRDIRLSISLIAIGILLGVFLVNKLFLKKSECLLRVPREVAALMALFVVSYVAWLVKFGYYRYFAAGELLCLVVITVVIYQLVRSEKWAAVTTLVVVSIITVTTIPINWGRLDWRPTWFGVEATNFTETADGTVFVANQPTISFVLPYFPDSTRIVTIGPSQDSTHPPRTDLMQRTIDEGVRRAIVSNTSGRFYFIRGDEAAVESEVALNALGFTSTNCKVMPVYSREGASQSLRLCEVVWL